MGNTPCIQPSTPPPTPPPSPSPTPKLYKCPWRESKSTYDQLVTEIKEIHPGKVSNILLVGPTNAGKSSTINSILSISRDRLVNKAFAGKKETSFTREYFSFDDEGILKHCCLWDSMGIEKVSDSGMLIEDIKLILEGHVKKAYKFNPKAKIEKDDTHFRENPGLEDKVHCVVLVLNSIYIDEDSLKPFKDKMIQLREKVAYLKIPYICILTNIDQICSEVRDDVGKAFCSTNVHKAVKTASDILGISEGHIHPIKNFETDVEFSKEAGLLVLIALRQLLHFSQDNIEVVQKESRPAATEKQDIK